MKKLLLLWFTMFWVLLAMPVFAQAPPKRYTLPNGIPLVVQEAYASPTVSLNIYIRVGSVFETPKLNGISHFYEHMFFRGTPTRNGLKFKRDIEALGGITNATTGRDFTHFYINVPKQYFREGLALLADAYLNAECSQESVDAERQVVLEEYRLGQAQPARILTDRLYGLLFPDHPYGRTIIGSEENLNTISRQDLLQFKKDFYVPARTKLVLTGDLDSQEALALASDLFGSYQAKGIADLPETSVAQQPPDKNVEYTESSKSGQSQVALAFLGPSVKQRADVHRVDLLSFMLGNSKSSLLGKAIDSKKTGLDGRVNYLTQAFPGIIMVLVDSESGKEQETLAKVDAVLARVRQGDFSDDDLKRAKKMLLTTYRFGLETNAGKADNWGVYETIDRMDFAKTYARDINKLTKADLMQAAEKYFSRGHYRLTLRSGKSGAANRG